MAEYHQLTLFNLEDYSSEPKNSNVAILSLIEEASQEIKYEQLELDLFPELPDDLAQAA